MFTRSVLTTIIGFLIGYILYLIIEPLSTFIFLFGGLGYVIGLILDNNDDKRQLQILNFSSIPPTHEFLHSDEIPEAVFIYSALDNTTTVLLDFRIEAKPENYRLSVLKNLQEFDFRIIEDTSQTFFSLSIEYPEFNYPSIKEIPHQQEIFFHDIKERSIDFQGAIQKLIPGIVICIVKKPDIFGKQTNLNYDSFSQSPPSFFPPPQSRISENPLFNKGNEALLTSNSNEKSSDIEFLGSEPENSYEQVMENHAVSTHAINEENIMEDLNQTVPQNHDSSTIPPEGSFSSDTRILIPNNDEDSIKIASISKKSSFLTAKQIEEAQDRILTYEKIQETQSERNFQSGEFETDENPESDIFDYSSVDTNTSMPLDNEGQGIVSTIYKAIKEMQARQSKNPEKIKSEDA